MKNPLASVWKGVLSFSDSLESIPTDSLLTINLEGQSGMCPVSKFQRQGLNGRKYSVSALNITDCKPHGHILVGTFLTYESRLPQTIV